VQSKLSLITTNETVPDSERPKTAASCRAKSASIVAFGRTSHQVEGAE